MKNEIKIKVSTYIICDESACSMECVFLEYDTEYAYCCLFQHFLIRNKEERVQRTPECYHAEVADE